MPDDSFLVVPLHGEDRMVGSLAEWDMDSIIAEVHVPNTEQGEENSFSEGHVLYVEPPNDTNDETTAPTGSPHEQLQAEEPAEHLESNILDLDEPVQVPEPRTPTNRSTSAAGSKRTRSRGSGSSSPVRKRSRNPSLWNANVRKTLKNSGQAYTSANGKPMKAAEMRPACSCKSNCRLRLTEEDRKLVFNQFWSTGDHERQWDFIRQNSSSKPTAARTNYQDKKKCSRSYFFIINEQKVMVCKKMFIATLGIWDCWIVSAYKHLNPAKGNTRTPDKRGRHQNHYVAVTADKTKTVIEHCNMFPRVPSHYCRERSKREYLEHGLSLNKMAKLYVEWAKTMDLPASKVATIRQYKDVINSHFNIGFFKPKKDQCGLCSTVRNKHNPRAIRERDKDLYSAHIKRKTLVRKIKLQDRSDAEKDPKIAVISFDLQKQLPCPRSEVGEFFYRNKLSVFNFTIFHEVERRGHCYLWHEGVAKKGSSEIASSLFHFIQKLVESGHNEIRFYSDNCGGQNKNRFVFAMYEYAAVLKSIKITHRFLEPGHTHMDADTIHARIENATKLKEVYDFDDWVREIEDAKEELPKYTVEKLKQSMIFNYKDLVSKQNWKKDMKGHDIKWSKVRKVSVDGREGNLVRLRYELDGEIITLSPNTVGRPVNLKTYSPPKEYSGPVPLHANKRTDLQYFCDRMIIPHDKQPFFRQVLAGTIDDPEDPLAEMEYDSDEELIAGIVGKVAEEKEQDEGEEGSEHATEEEDGNEESNDGEEDDM